MFEDAVEILWQPVSGGGGVSTRMSACTAEQSFDIYFCAEGASLYSLSFLLCGVT